MAVRPYDRTASRETDQTIILPIFCSLFEGLERKVDHGKLPQSGRCAPRAPIFVVPDQDQDQVSDVLAWLLPGSSGQAIEVGFGLAWPEPWLMRWQCEKSYVL